MKNVKLIKFLASSKKLVTPKGSNSVFIPKELFKELFGNTLFENERRLIKEGISYSEMEDYVNIVSREADLLVMPDNLINKENGRFVITIEQLNKMRYNNKEYLKLVDYGSYYKLEPSESGVGNISFERNGFGFSCKNDDLDSIGYSETIPIIFDRAGSYIMKPEALLFEPSVKTIDPEFHKVDIIGAINSIWVSAYQFDEAKIKRNHNGFYDALEDSRPVKIHNNALCKLIHTVTGEVMSVHDSLFYISAMGLNIEYIGDYSLIYIDLETVYENNFPNGGFDLYSRFSDNKISYRFSPTGDGRDINSFYHTKLGYSTKHLNILPLFGDGTLYNSASFQVKTDQKNFKNSDGVEFIL